MTQLMAQVHSLSKDLKDMQEKIKERDETIDKLHAVPDQKGIVREFGKGAPQPVDKKITERLRSTQGTFMSLSRGKKSSRYSWNPRIGDGEPSWIRSRFGA